MAYLWFQEDVPEEVWRKGKVKSREKTGEKLRNKHIG